MKYIIWIPLMWLIACQNPTPPVSQPSSKVVIAYVAGWKDWKAQDIDVQSMTHINYAFADVIEGKVVGYLEDDSANFAQLNSLRAVNPDIKILISIGGWARSKGFSDAVLSEASRDTLARTGIEYLKKYQLDGLDIDWEYPGLVGDNNPHRPEDKENFTLMLKEMRRQLDLQEAADGREYLLTIATGASKSYLEHTNMREAQEYLDFVNIMTYDFAGGHDSLTDHHSNPYGYEGPNNKGRGTDVAVAEHLAAGVPASKLVVGIAFYGKGWRGVNPENNGLHQAAEGGYRGMAYHSLDEVLGKGFVRHWDDQAQAPYLFHPDSAFFISYEDTASVQVKVDMIQEKDLAGAMFWEYNSDTTGALLEVMAKGLLP